MSDKTEKQDCPCSSINCSRYSDCEKCMAAHHTKGTRTSCGK